MWTSREQTNKLSKCWMSSSIIQWSIFVQERFIVSSVANQRWSLARPSRFSSRFIFVFHNWADRSVCRGGNGFSKYGRCLISQSEWHSCSLCSCQNLEVIGVLVVTPGLQFTCELHLPGRLVPPSLRASRLPLPTCNSFLFWHHRGGTSFWLMSGQQSRLPASSRDSRLTCAELTWTLQRGLT